MDPSTGHVNVVKVVVVQDIGRVINPLTLEGQMHGGIVQWIGMALNEEVVMDHGQPERHDGQLPRSSYCRKSQH